MQVIWDRQFGFLKETLVAPVSRLSIMFGRTLGGATVASLQGIIVLIVTVIAGFRPVSWYGVFPAIIMMFLVGLLFSALGMMVASLLKDMQGFQLIMNFLVMPLFFLSGALYPLKNMPFWIRMLSYLDPLTYGVDGMRGALIQFSSYSLFIDFIILTGFSLLMVFLGAYFFEKSESV
jgi:ABC-2 type transport system permease protein